MMHMSDRRLLIAANWKMNASPLRSADTASAAYLPREQVDVVVFPSFLDIAECIKMGVVTGGQTARAEDNGAYTGDISMHMLRDAGVRYVLCGHSERRKLHGETNDDVAAEVEAALDHELIPLVCIGESEKDYESGKSEQVVEQQLDALLSLLRERHIDELLLAYEPVWAIGTGKTADTKKIASMHGKIRMLVSKQNVETRILYGGSVKPENAKEILELDEVDGVLVGGASLEPDSFTSIIDAGVSVH